MIEDLIREDFPAEPLGLIDTDALSLMTYITMYSLAVENLDDVKTSTGKIDEAEEAFRAMLEEPANSDYAMQELAYIQNLRQKNERGHYSTEAATKLYYDENKKKVVDTTTIKRQGRNVHRFLQTNQRN